MSNSLDTPFLVQVNGTTHKVMTAEAQSLDFINNNDKPYYHLLDNNTAYQVELVAADYRTKEFTFRVNGNLYNTKISDKYDQLVQKLGLKVGGHQKINDLKAPMPGLVLDIAVEIGQKVQKGDKILILEAMKMENIIKAAADVTIKSIHITQGQAVDKGQLLLDFE